MAITVFQNLTKSNRAILKGRLVFCAIGQANEIFTHPATTQAVALLKSSLNRNPALGVPGSGVSALNLFRWAAGRFGGELLLSGAIRDRNLKMGASFCSLTQKNQSRNDSDLGFQGFGGGLPSKRPKPPWDRCYSPDSPLRVESYPLGGGPWWRFVDAYTGRPFAGRFSGAEVNYLVRFFKTWHGPVGLIDFGAAAARAIEACHTEQEVAL